MSATALLLAPLLVIVLFLVLAQCGGTKPLSQRQATMGKQSHKKQTEQQRGDKSALGGTPQSSGRSQMDSQSEDLPKPKKKVPTLADPDGRLKLQQIQKGHTVGRDDYGTLDDLSSASIRSTDSVDDQKRSSKGKRSKEQQQQEQGSIKGSIAAGGPSDEDHTQCATSTQPPTVETNEAPAPAPAAGAKDTNKAPTKATGAKQQAASRPAGSATVTSTSAWVKRPGGKGATVRVKSERVPSARK